MIRTDNSKVIELLQSQLEAKQWINIKTKERLPSFGAKVLAWDGSDIHFAVYNGNEFLDNESWVLYGITHWMPLPEPPKQS